MKSIGIRFSNRKGARTRPAVPARFPENFLVKVTQYLNQQISQRYFAGWRDYMDLTRFVAFHLAKNGEIEICQKGETVKDEDVRGPIRLRIKIN